MKHLGNILAAIVLSFTLVMLGGGVALVSCLHRGTTALTLLADSDTGNDATAPCCADMADTPRAEHKDCCGHAEEAHATSCEADMNHGPVTTDGCEAHATSHTDYTQEAGSPDGQALNQVPGCMRTAVLKLSPYDVAQPTTSLPPITYVALPPFAIAQLPPVPVRASNAVIACAAEARHGPPRTRLTRQCVWRL